MQISYNVALSSPTNQIVVFAIVSSHNNTDLLVAVLNATENYQRECS